MIVDMKISHSPNVNLAKDLQCFDMCLILKLFENLGMILEEFVSKQGFEHLVANNILITY